MSRGKRGAAIAPGIYPDPLGFSVIARLGSGDHLLSSPEIRFPPSTPLLVMQERWIIEKRKLQDQRSGTRVTRGTLAADVVLYFQTARLSTQRKQEREQQLQWWVNQFGTRRRLDLDPRELTQALNRLQCAASTRNKYRTALSNLFTVLDGKSAKNPIRDVPKRKEPRPTRRDQSYELIEVIIDKLRTNGRGSKPSEARAFLWVLAYVPVTRPQLELMTSADVHWESNEITVPDREKGEGAPGRRKPVSALGMAALRNFDAGGFWGKKSTKSNLTKAFRGARDRAIAELRVTKPCLDLSTAHRMQRKDLRHSFLTAFFRWSGDLALTAKMGDHKLQSTTDRYAMGAVEPLLKIAGAKVADGFAQLPAYVPPPPVEVPHTVPHTPVDESGEKRISLVKMRGQKSGGARNRDTRKQRIA